MVTVGSMRDQILTASSHQFRWRPQKEDRNLSDYPRPFGSATVGTGKSSYEPRRGARPCILKVGSRIR